MTHETTISHLKSHLSAVLDLVKGGNTLVVTDHGRPVAQISPYAAGDVERTLVDLVRRGLIRPAKKELDVSRLHPELAPDPGGVALHTLLDERQTGR